LVVRWPEDRSVLAGRSECDHCQAVLGPLDLVPLLSAAMLRGRCRRCGGAIDPVHWRIEAGALAIGIVSGALLPGVGGIATALFGWLLTQVDSAFAGRAYAAYGGVYIAASLLWLWLAEGLRPDRFDAAGAALALVGAGIILAAPR